MNSSGAGDSPRQPLVYGDVRAPDLREPEIGIGDIELVAGCPFAGHACWLVAIRIGLNGNAVVLVAETSPIKHPGVPELVGDPDIKRRPGEQAGAARTCVRRLPLTSQLTPQPAGTIESSCLAIRRSDTELESRPHRGT